MKKIFVLLTLAVLLVPAGFAKNPSTGGPSAGQNAGALPPPASYAAWEWSTSGVVFTNGNWTFGQVFTTNNAPVNVTYLGYYNQGFDGFGAMQDSHPVTIWDANGGVVAAATIDANSCNVAFSTHFCYLPVTATLAANTTYEITGVSGIDNYEYGSDPLQINPLITYDGYNYCLGCGDTFTGFGTTDLGVGPAFFGPNFGKTENAIPEPGSLILLGSGILGLAGTLRRKLF